MSDDMLLYNFMGMRNAKFALIAHKAELFRLRAFIDAFNFFGSDYLLIKGWAVGRFYPTDDPRVSTDIDLVLARADFPKAAEWVKHHCGPNTAVDLHREFGDRDPLPWEVLFARSRMVDLDGVGVRVLADEDNLRLTAAHWLIDGGVYEERLKDIYYLVKNRKPDFDWELCLYGAGRIRRTWVLTAIATARDYLDLDVSELPADIRDFELPKWYKSTLEKEWKLGPYLRMPAQIAFRSPKLLFEQIRRRFPPNPIAATCDIESPFDHSPRWALQLKSLRKRMSNKL